MKLGCIRTLVTYKSISSGIAQVWLRILTLTWGEASETLRQCGRPANADADADTINSPSWGEASRPHCAHPSGAGGAWLRTWFLALMLTLLLISSFILPMLFLRAASWSCLSRGSTVGEKGKWGESEDPTLHTRCSEQPLPGPECFLGWGLPKEWSVRGMPYVGTSPESLRFLLTHHRSTWPGLSQTLNMGDHGQDHPQS